MNCFCGTWLSLVEHPVRGRGVGGSNPLVPTFRIKQIQPVSEWHWKGLQSFLKTSQLKRSKQHNCQISAVVSNSDALPGRSFRFRVTLIR